MKLPNLYFLLFIFISHFSFAQQKDTANYIFVSTDEPAQFSGGQKGFNTFLETHLKFPETEHKLGLQGTCEVEFVVNIDGRISDILVLKSAGNPFDQEVIRLIKLMPNWKPARIGKREVRSYHTMPFVFENEDANKDVQLLRSNSIKEAKPFKIALSNTTGSGIRPMQACDIYPIIFKNDNDESLFLNNVKDSFLKNIDANWKIEFDIDTDNSYKNFQLLDTTTENKIVLNYVQNNLPKPICAKSNNMPVNCKMMITLFNRVEFENVMIDGINIKAYRYPEKEPSFPGGIKGLINFLVNELNYPDKERNKGLSATVNATFIVTKTGEIKSLNTIGNNEVGFVEEAKRVIKKMPKWIPGSDQGVVVDCFYTLPIRFVLEE
jgi:TonB family protein